VKIVDFTTFRRPSSGNPMTSMTPGTPLVPSHMHTHAHMPSSMQRDRGQPARAGVAPLLVRRFDARGAGGPPGRADRAADDGGLRRSKHTWRWCRSRTHTYTRAHTRTYSGRRPAAGGRRAHDAPIRRWSAVEHGAYRRRGGPDARTGDVGAGGVRVLGCRVAVHTNKRTGTISIY
jgi:hypothetical protein